MLHRENKFEQCTICTHEYTSIHTKVAPDVKIYVCDTCLEAAKHNFIWICMSCGKVYLRPKKLALQRLKDSQLKRAYMLCEDMQIIKGIDMCITCDMEGIMNYMKTENMAVC